MLWCLAPKITSRRKSLHGLALGVVLEVSGFTGFALCGSTSILPLSRTNNSFT